jgi:hypothetical protein
MGWDQYLSRKAQKCKSLRTSLTDCRAFGARTPKLSDPSDGRARPAVGKPAIFLSVEVPEFVSVVSQIPLLKWSRIDGF